MSTVPNPTSAQLEALAPLVDGDLATELASRPVDGYAQSLADAAASYRKELDTAHTGWGEATAQLDRARIKERTAREREAMYAQWLDNACDDRDAQTRRARKWKIAAWALFLLLVVSVAWRFRA